VNHSSFLVNSGYLQKEKVPFFDEERKVDATAALKGPSAKNPGAPSKEFSSRMDPDDEEPAPKATEPSRGSMRTRQSKPSLLDDNDIEMEDGEGSEADLVEKTTTATSSNAQGKRRLTQSQVETAPKRARVTEKSTGAMRQFHAIGGTPGDSTSSAPATLHAVERKRLENLPGRPLLAEGGRRATEKNMASTRPIDLSGFEYNEGDRVDYELVPALLGKVRHS
jgi:hypothetical protein